MMSRFEIVTSLCRRTTTFEKEQFAHNLFTITRPFSPNQCIFFACLPAPMALKRIHVLFLACLVQKCRTKDNATKDDMCS